MAKRFFSGFFDKLFFNLAVLGLLILIFNTQLVYGTYAAPKPIDVLDKIPVSQPIYVPGELLIKFKDKVARNLPKEINGPKLPGNTSLNQLNYKNDVSNFDRVFNDLKNEDSAQKLGLKNIYRAKLAKEADIKSIAAQYQKNSDVEWAEPNYLRFTQATPDDTNYASQWNLNQASDHDIDAPEAWDVQKAENGVPVPEIAVIDTGVDWDHVDLAANIWSNPGEIPANGIDDDGHGYIDDIRGWDFVDTSCLNPGDCPIPGYGDLICTDADCTVFDPDPNDDQGHGTWCSGIASAATNNATGMAGVSWNAKIMPVRAGWKGTIGGAPISILEDAASSASLVYAADLGAEVVSMSWGSPIESSTVRTAINYAHNAGLILVAAAGNNVPTPPYVLYPAAYSQVVAVGATDSDDHYVSSYNYASWIDASAPGYSIYSTYLADAYTTASGTSGATPHVAGVAALIKANKPTWSKQAIVKRLINRTEYIDYISGQSLTFQQKMGQGRLNANQALGSDYTHPDGSLVKIASSPAIFMLEGHVRWVPTWDVFISNYELSDVVTISDGEFLGYSQSEKIKLPDGTLVKGSSGAIYVIENQALRHITTWPTFVSLGYNMGQVHNIEDGSLSLYYTPGDSWTATSYHPSGTLVKTASSASVYRLEDGQRRLVKDWNIFVENAFNPVDVITISDVEMGTYTNGSGILLPDGTLIKGSGAELYVIEYGMKRQIMTWEKFVSLGYSASNVLTISDTDLTNDYPTGATIS